MNQTGRSMIEMLGVLAIIGVLSLGGLTGYSKAMTRFKTNATIEAMLTIAANVKTMTLRLKNYSNIDKAAIKMKAIPDKLLTADKKNLGINAFGGSVDVKEFGDRSFYVAMSGLPKDVCLEIATKDFGNAVIYAGGETFNASNVGISTTTNLKVASPACGSNYCIKKIMSPSIAASACSCTAPTCSVAIIMY